MPLHDETFNLNIWDHSPVAYCVAELVLDADGQPVDWIYRYCNQAFADVKEYRLKALLDHACLELSLKVDEKCLQAYYADAFILEEDKKEFLDWHSCENMRRRLCKRDRITYHYHSVSKQGEHSFYEAYAVKGHTDEDIFQIFWDFVIQTVFFTKRKRFNGNWHMLRFIEKKRNEQGRLTHVSLVNDILDINKLEAGDLIDQEITFDLTDLLNRANTDKQIEASDKNVDYIVDWGRADIKHMYLCGNPIYVERLLTTVSDNAVKFTQPGGSIHVWCAEKATGGEQVIYEFGCSDNGIGMNGWDATRKIRSMKRSDSATVPIIAISANSFAEDIINSRISGINRHISKPLDATKLFGALKECLCESLSQNIKRI